MTEVLFIFMSILAATYFLFIHKRSMNKTLTASRWLLLAWTVLCLFFAFNPVQYHAFEVSAPTVLYCLVWLLAFIGGDHFGYLCGPSDGAAAPRAPELIPKKFLTLLDRLIVLSLLCGAYYGYVKLHSLGGNSLEFVMSDLRGALVSEGESKLSVLAVDVAMSGLVFSLIRISCTIMENKAPSLLALGGIFAYLSVYVFRAGRQGIAISVVALAVTLAASLQASRRPYRYGKRLAVVTVCLFTLLVSYFTYNTLTRSTGAASVGLSLDRKIAFAQRALSCTIDPKFIDSMQKIDPIGSSLVELFIYYSPQFYGLDFTMKHPHDQHVWGGLQFNYFVRSFEKMLGLDVIVPTISAWENVFNDYGLYSNFFRTAVATTYMDFGPVFSIFFIFLCGFFAGTVRKTALTTGSPFFIAFEGLICSGVFMTNIYSPFCEIGWAYPWLMFMLLYFVFIRKNTRYVRCGQTAGTGAGPGSAVLLPAGEN